jgi:hypothetical protein
MLPELIKKIFDFIVPNKNPECDKIVNSAIKLVMFQPIIQKEVKKCCNFFSCFRKKETSIESKPLMEELNSISSTNQNKVEVTQSKVESNEVQVVVNESKIEVNEVLVVVNENKVEVSEIVEVEVEVNEVNKVSENKVSENKKNKLNLDNIEITSDDELVNINVVNEINEDNKVNNIIEL